MNRKLVLTAILISTFLSAMEATIVATAMPSIIEDLNGMEYISMIFSIYLLVTAVTTPIYGKLADLFGRKRIFSIAIVIFLIGSSLSGFAHSMTMLIVFRAIQAVGAGAMAPLTSTIIGDIYTPEEQTRMQALFGGVWAISGVVGPLIGGFIVEVVNWRWVFFINLPFGILSLVLLWLTFHEKFKPSGGKSIDWAGAFSFLISITSLLYVLLFGKINGFFAPYNVICEAAFVLFLVLFIFIEKRAAEPFLPLDLFKNKLILIPNLFGFFAFSVLISTSVYLPLWLQQISHQTPTLAGLALTSAMVGWPLAASFTGRLIRSFGPWTVCLLGSILILTSGILLASIHPGTSIVLFFVTMFVAGLGFGLSITVMMIILQNSVEGSQRGVAMSSNALLNTLGQTIFIAILGAVYNSVSDGSTAAGMSKGIHTVFLCVAAITAVAFVVLQLPKITKEELFSKTKSAL
jgi:EmrB/QacA subfamily drug resistance transporter